MPEIRSSGLKTPIVLVGTQSDLRTDVKVRHSSFSHRLSFVTRPYTDYVCRVFLMHRGSNITGYLCLGLCLEGAHLFVRDSGYYPSRNFLNYTSIGDFDAYKSREIDIVKT